jgi:hypothetical protein
MAVLLHKESLCPDEGAPLLGNEVLYDMKHRLNRDLENGLVDAGQLTLECLRYMLQ